jgi:hypothetical protein
MRITDQYFWNIVFLLLFGAFFTSSVIILEGNPTAALHTLTPFEFVILSLATFRLTRLFVHDKITAFFREQFYDAKKLKTGIVLEKPKSGARRTLADLMSCQWCFSMWAGAIIIFSYELTPYAWYPILVLALSGVSSFFQCVATYIGSKADVARHEAEGV